MTTVDVSRMVSPDQHFDVSSGACQGPRRGSSSSREDTAPPTPGHEWLPIPLADNLVLAEGLDGDVYDAGTLERYLDDEPFPDFCRDCASDALKIVGCCGDHTPLVARTLDAGLFLARLNRLGEFSQLRTWIAQYAPQEASCAAS